MTFKEYVHVLKWNLLCSIDFVLSQNLVNSTNLAVKGIVGIGAMARLAEYVGDNDDASRFRVRPFSQIMH